MKYWSHVFGIFAVTFFAYAVTYQSMQTVPVVGKEAPANEFSAVRAMDQLNHLLQEQKPHPVDSLENKLVAKRIEERLIELGYQPEIQETTYCWDSDRGFARCAQLQNILVHIKGTAPKQDGILLSAHYDSVAASMGGNDAGSAVVAILEVARLLSVSKKQFPQDIVLLFNDAEELGLIGARAFMNEHPLAKTVSSVLNVDAIGSDGKSLLIEGEGNAFIKSLAKSSKSMLASSIIESIWLRIPSDTDMTVFKHHGMLGLNLIHLEGCTHYHTPLDNLANTNLGSIQNHGDNVWGVLNQQQSTNRINGNLVYSDVFGQFIVSFTTTQVRLLSLLLLAVTLVLTIFHTARKQDVLLTNGVNVIWQSVKGASFFVAVLAMMIALIGTYTYFLTSDETQAPWLRTPLEVDLAIMTILLLALSIGAFRLKQAYLNQQLFAMSLNQFWTLGLLATAFVQPQMSLPFLLLSFLSLLSWLVVSFSKKQWPLWPILLLKMLVLLPVIYMLEKMVKFEPFWLMPIIYSVAFINVALLVFNLNAPDKKTFSIFISMIILAGAFTDNRTGYSKELPQSVNIKYVQNWPGSWVIVEPKDGIESNAIKSAYPKLRDQQILPWLKQPSRNQAAKILKLPELSLTVTDVQKTTLDNGQIQSVFQLIANEFEQSIVGFEIYINGQSKLQEINALGRQAVYQDEKPTRNGYYQFICMGESCLNNLNNNEFTLTVLGEEPVEIYVVAIHKDLPQAIELPKSKFMVEHSEGHQTLVLHKQTL